MYYIYSTLCLHDRYPRIIQVSMSAIHGVRDLGKKKERMYRLRRDLPPSDLPYPYIHHSP